MKRSLSIAALACAAISTCMAQGVAKPLPWPCDPLTNASVPYQRIETVDGSAVIWIFQVNTVVRPFEIHYTQAWASPANIAATLATFAIDPVGTFWRNAKTSSCFDLKGYWPTAQERNLCATVRSEWAKWVVK